MTFLQKKLLTLLQETSSNTKNMPWNHPIPNMSNSSPTHQLSWCTWYQTKQNQHDNFFSYSPAHFIQRAYLYASQTLTFYTDGNYRLFEFLYPILRLYCISSRIAKLRLSYSGTFVVDKWSFTLSLKNYYSKHSYYSSNHIQGIPPNLTIEAIVIEYPTVRTIPFLYFSHEKYQIPVKNSSSLVNTYPYF